MQSDPSEQTEISEENDATDSGIKCTFCEKRFKSKAGVSKHEKHCTQIRGNITGRGDIDRPISADTDKEVVGEGQDSVQSDSATQIEKSSQEKQMTKKAVEIQKDQSKTKNRNEASESELKCSFCPKICKNKGSLASHRKACEIKKHPSLLKSRRRLSRSVHEVTNHVDDKDRRLGFFI